MQAAPTPSARDGTRRLDVSAWRDGRLSVGPDLVADEVPVALEFNGLSHAVMLATPSDLDDFALGFALSEGLLDHPRELYGIETTQSGHGITVSLDVASSAFVRLKARRRLLAGRTGCGLCGIDSLDQVERPLPASAPADDPIAPTAVARAMRELAALQSLNRDTGAMHAAAWCTPDGEVRRVREDVGRHNALDKLIGALHRAGDGQESPCAGRARHGDPAVERGFVAITSRASVEMVQKVLTLGVPLLAAVSAPTAYAVSLARRGRLSLVGFARGENLVAYAGAHRLFPDARACLETA